MEAKQYLGQVERLDLYIAQAQRKINKLKRSATSTSANMGGERVSSSGNKQKMADTVDQYIDIERQDLARYKRERAEILHTLERLKVRLRFIVLYEHYFNGKSLKKISAETRYSYSHVKKAHGKGLKELQEILDK